MKASAPLRVSSNACQLSMLCILIAGLVACGVWPNGARAALRVERATIGPPLGIRTVNTMLPNQFSEVDGYWDGGFAMSGWDGAVQALTVDRHGNVYVGGSFSSAGGVPANYIAKWDGVSWTALGDGVDNLVFALAVDDADNVYAGGWFTTAGGQSAMRIAKWDGSSWSPMGSGMDGAVYSLAIDHNGIVYAGGMFTTAGSVAAMSIAAWDGTSWSPLGAGLYNPWDVGMHAAFAIAIDADNNIYAGGEFVRAGDIETYCIAKWDGATWSELDGGTDQEVFAIVIDDDGNIYAGGDAISRAGNVEVRSIAKWDGDSWSPLGAGIGGYVYALAIDHHGNLYAGGDFGVAGEVAASCVAHWNGVSWSPMGSGTSGTVFSLDADESGNVYAGGGFSTAGGVTSNCVAMWHAAIPVCMDFDFRPSTLNLSSHGLWVSGYLEPPAPISVNEIDVSSIRINGTVPVDVAAPIAIGDEDADGIPDLMVKWNRASVELTVAEGDQVPVTVTGVAGGRRFAGTDYIRVRRAVVSSPSADSQLVPGTVAQVRWETPRGVTAKSIALLQSFDGGSTWDLVTRDHANTGLWDWMVPSVSTQHAKLALVLVEEADESGLLVDGVLGISADFSIQTAASVGNNPSGRALMLAQNQPNPFNPCTTIKYDLPEAGAVRLSVFDLAGRLVRTLVDESMPQGSHEAVWDGKDVSGREVSSGTYLARLSFGGRVETVRMGLIR